MSTSLSNQIQSNQINATPYRLLENLAGSVPVTEVLARVCDYIDDESPGAVSAVLMLDEAKMEFRLVASPRVPAFLCEAIDGLKVPPCDGNCGTAVHQGMPVKVWDITRDSLFANQRSAALSTGFAAAWSLPIWSTMRTALGTVFIFHPESQMPFVEIPKAMETAVHLATIAIKHYRIEAETRELTRRLLQSQDDERRRLARDLHDSTGQELASLLMTLDRAKLKRRRPPSELVGILSECRSIAAKISGEIRTLSCLLHPPVLDICGLGAAIEAYASDLSRRRVMKVEVEIPPRLPRLPPDTEVALFRVVQAALTNIHLHSGTDKAKIKMEKNAEMLTLTVSDDGRGIPAAVLNRFSRLGDSGVGIAGMRERVRALGGRLEIETLEKGPKHGTRLKVIIPDQSWVSPVT
jgi:signal transduction histidine kinase